MEEIFLDAHARLTTGRAYAKDVRESGFIPAVIYGEGKSAQSIKIAHRQLVQLLHQHGLENLIISVKFVDDAQAKARPCLIKEVQRDPVKEHIVHVDFHEISLTKELKLNIPVVAKGESVGVKQDGGSLEHIMWEIEVSCLPTNIPKEIEVDVTALKIGDDIHVRDLVLPAGVKALTSVDAVVLSVKAPIVEKVAEEAVEGEEKKEPEVIKEKKEVAEEGKEGKAEPAKEKEKK